MPISTFVIASLVIGAGATLLIDLWAMVLRRLGVPTLNFAMVGRWAGHLLQGRLRHVAIAKAQPVRAELMWGWIIHYAIGVLFAALLLAACGSDWLQSPLLWPALVVGVGSVVAPLCIMQPAMGAGFAASKTPTPLCNCLRSLVTHTIFGLGLYLSGLGFSVFAA
ncbi:DUF2938 domain-containing protein [Pseudomonas auratipiscis]|uniref:DUF2938 domain-containing protein n=1 Tax=Pseudomonas auratipiscis TaxID=3115853 RepID=A0AB35WPD9_9PSED|nr:MULTISPECIES: DUF2938 domain-containing protein [unclassified Pseudomonas]MEE1866530.1 DUF2938 domain-containing protein [Pseudomonas sp. 120P]MEE1957305.1 DUF2938 domain-containing protein [Pseudomonas sp. 119P]